MCNHVQKQLEIDSVAISEHDNKLQLSEAGQQGQGKGPKEEKVCACVHRLQAFPVRAAAAITGW